MNKPFIIGISAAVAALGYLLFKGTSLKETVENVRVSLASLPKIHKIDLSGLKVSVDLRVDNPGKERITVKIPSVRLSHVQITQIPTLGCFFSNECLIVLIEIVKQTKHIIVLPNFPQTGNDFLSIFAFLLSFFGNDIF